MTDSPAAPAPHKVTLYRNGSVYTAADPFATAMLVDGDTVAWVGSEQAATSIADCLDGGRRPARRAPRPRLRRLPRPPHRNGHRPGLAAARRRPLCPGTARRRRRLLRLRFRRGRHRARPWLGRDPVGGLHPAHAGRTGTRRRRPAGLPLPGRCALALVSSSLAAAAGLRRLDGSGTGGQVKRAAHTAARLAARRFPPPRSAATSSGPWPRLRPTATSPWRKWLPRTSAASRTSSWPRPGTPAAGRAVPGDPAILGRTGAPRNTPGRSGRAGRAVRGLAGDLNIDGSIGSRTAALRADYSDAPGERGSLYLSAAEAAAHLAACSLLGIQAGFHVIGDAGLDAALDALDLAAADVGEQRIRAAGHRLEHVEIADAEAIRRLANYSVTVSAQPGFDAAWGAPDGLYQQRLGSRRGGMNPFASFYAAGVPICFGSDSPVTPLRPWASVRACLQHNNPAQRISARAAFLGHTRAGWRAARYRNPMAGQLVPGAPGQLRRVGCRGADGPGGRRPGPVLEHGSPRPDAAAAGPGHRHRACVPADRPGWPGTVLQRLAPRLTAGAWNTGPSTEKFDRPPCSPDLR